MDGDRGVWSTLSVRSALPVLVTFRAINSFDATLVACAIPIVEPVLRRSQPAATAAIGSVRARMRR